MITRQQIRTPRTMLGWTQNELAQAAEISGMAVRNIESGATADPRPSTVAALRQAVAALTAGRGLGRWCRRLGDGRRFHLRRVYGDADLLGAAIAVEVNDAREEQQPDDG
ncbi:helix-turn-helix domain-containing protein [Mesorhizobium sp. M2E.F.Ca.ET.209.01.1.1]|nr:helix-turn-helix domain-containing protein [Mesorhizobium sp. M2E.F.Ca.ET.209.01.1.1]